VRNDSDGKHVILYGGYREADAVNGNRSLVNDIPVKFFGDAEAKPVVAIPEYVQPEEFARAVNVPLYDVTMQPAGGEQRPLEIHDRTRMEIPKIRAA
jgi:hypothetical protein